MRGELPGRQASSAADPLAGAAETMVSLSGAARRGSLDTVAALTSLTAARRLAAELERSELALIEAARDGGATWSQIAAAMGTRNRQTAQKRHADLSRRWPRPSSQATSGEAEPAASAPPAGARHEERGDPGITAPGDAQHRASLEHRAAITYAPGAGSSAAQAGDRTSTPTPAARPAPREETRSPHAAGRNRQPAPKITDTVIAGSRYELVRAPDHAETRSWHVLVDGKRAGLVRPTWRGERSRPGWEPVDNTGTALPATGIGRTTPAGHASTRDAAAVSLLRALQRQQEDERRKLAR